MPPAPDIRGDNESLEDICGALRAELARLCPESASSIVVKPIGSGGVIVFAYPSDDAVLQAVPCVLESGSLKYEHVTYTTENGAVPVLYITLEK